MKARRFLAILSVLLCWCPAVASAQQAPPIPGKNEIAFAEAVSFWLDGDDARSIPAFLELARRGNVAAQVMLGEIEVLSRAGSAFTGAMTTREFLAYVRDSEEAVEKSWHAGERRRHAIQAALFEVRRQFRKRVSADFEQAIILLREAGDRSYWHTLTALRAVSVLYDRSVLHGTDWTPFLEDARKGTVDPLLEPFAWMLAILLPGNPSSPALVESGLERMGRDPAAFALMDELLGSALLNNAVDLGSISLPPELTDDRAFVFTSAPFSEDTRRSLENLLTRAPQATSMRAICADACPPSSQGRCLRTLYSMTPGYYALMSEGFPVKELIDDERYWKSKRARIQFWRRQLDGKLPEFIAEWALRGLPETATGLQCLADAVPGELSAAR